MRQPASLELCANAIDYRLCVSYLLPSVYEQNMQLFRIDFYHIVKPVAVGDVVPFAGHPER